MSQVLGVLQGYDIEGRPKRPTTRMGVTGMTVSAMTEHGELIAHLKPDGEFEFVARSVTGEEVLVVKKNLHKLLERKGLLR